MRSHCEQGPVKLVVTAAESVEALLVANERAFTEKFDEVASQLVDGCGEGTRQTAIIFRAAAETCARLREAITAGRIADRLDDDAWRASHSVETA